MMEREAVEVDTPCAQTRYAACAETVRIGCAMRAAREIKRIEEAAALAAQFGLIIAAGHGLTARNVGALAAISEIKEFNIGHSIISRSIFVGLENAVKEMIRAIK